MILNNSGVDGGHEAAAAAQRVAGYRHHQHQRGLKKGPWTAAEDAILMEYVKKHGEGNWNAVQKNSGLARCGKSCRLRWANHLRPNLKKGSLSPEEERLIIELHAKMGNKWARMASQLPGRTDNEIKNYWNTRMKRRQRAGLPLYPHGLQQEAAAAAFHHHHAHHHQHVRNSSSSSASSFASLLSSSQPRKPSNYSPSHLSLYDHMTSFSSTSDHHNPNNNYTLQNYHHSSSSLYPMTQFNGNGGFALPLSPISPFGSSSSSAQFNQTNIPNQTLLSTSTPSLHHQYNSHAHGGFGYGSLSLSSMIMGTPTYDSKTAMVQGSNSELPSNQTLSNIIGGGEDIMGGSDNTNEDHYEIAPAPSQGNNGLLDDVLAEAHIISNKRWKSDDSFSGASGKERGGEEEDDESAEEEDEETVQVESTMKNSGENSAQNQGDDSSSPSSIGMKQSEDPLEEMDEDLLSLLNFPSTVPAGSESWYLGMPNRASSTSDKNVSTDIQQNAPLTPSVKTSTAAPEVKRTLGPCYWNKHMLRIEAPC